MRQKLLAQLVSAPRDLDYVERFQALAAVNLEIRRLGPAGDRLLRKALLEMDVGNFAAGLTAAQDAAAIRPDDPEVYFVMGKALVLLAMVKAEALPGGPGPGSAVEESATGLLLAAADAFRRASQLNRQDEEVQWDLATVEALLKKHETERGLLRALRAAA